MSARPYGHKEGTFLYEDDRLRSCGPPKIRIRRAAPQSVADTVSGPAVSRLLLARPKGKTASQTLYYEKGPQRAEHDRQEMRLHPRRS
jgi:hypothetical protein